MSELCRVVVTGIGVVSPVGNWPGPFFDNVAAGRSGIRLLPAGEHTSPVQVAAWIEAPIEDGSKGVPPDRVTQLALAAGRYALMEAGLLDRPELLTDIWASILVPAPAPALPLITRFTDFTEKTATAWRQ